MEDQEFDLYIVKALFSVFLILVIVFTGGMAQKMSRSTEFEEFDYFSDDFILYDDANMIPVIGMEEEDEKEMRFIDR